MPDLQPMSVDSAVEPWGSSPEFELYDDQVKTHNPGSIKNSFDASQILQQAVQILAENPELSMAL